jgi:acetyl-CoA synthetase
MSTKWSPDNDTITSCNIQHVMAKLNISHYQKFHKWSSENRKEFWKLTSNQLNISFNKPYKQFLNIDNGLENATWFDGAKMNIAESCFNAPPQNIALKVQTEDGDIQEISYAKLKNLSHQVGASLQKKGFKACDAIAIDMPMTYEAVAIYLGAILAGMQVVTIADSFAPEEIKVRLDITGAKLVFTQDVILRAGKTLPLYEKIKQAGDYRCITIQTQKESMLQAGDLNWTSFLDNSCELAIHYADPEETITVLFSSGTTGSPKAIPWNHTTPVKSASDGYYHHNIQEGDTICWPTNLGWMMGPWLVFASLINKATMALYYGAPLGEGFGNFIEKTEVNMLGVVPSLVRSWRAAHCMEAFDWSKIKCFSSTGECSNPDDMSYLMSLAGNKPVIEYCGGTETGGGYITGTVIQNAIPGTFSTPALGGDFLILDENGQPCDNGEVFLLPPIMGLSTRLLNRDHHKVYYDGTPSPDSQLCRRHGDQIERLANGYFKANGRVDDSMNLGGIKVSSTQIEELINQLPFVEESAAIGVPPQGGGPDQLIICYVESDAIDKSSALKQMKAAVKAQLNPLFKVSDCLSISELPRTASNKVMRRKLRDIARSR